MYTSKAIALESMDGCPCLPALYHAYHTCVRLSLDCLVHIKSHIVRFDIGN